MKAMIDAELCTGCGLCASTAPDIFEMTDDKAIVITDDIEESQEAECREAADSCPVEAIKVI